MKKTTLLMVILCITFFTLNATIDRETAAIGLSTTEIAACPAPVITSNPPNRAVCSGANTTFMMTATGATTYQWQVNTGSGFVNIINGAPYSNATTATLTITNVLSGMSGYLYRCVAISDTCTTNTSSGTLSVSNITVSSSQTNVSCNSGSNGSASVTPSGGLGGYSYSWSPSGGTGATATGLIAGSYTCTITDGVGCTTSRLFTITQPTALSLTAVSQTNISCYAGSNGSASVSTPTGGTAGYTYDWSPGNPTGDGTTSVTGLTAGTWTCTVTDANGCTASRVFTITQPTALSLTAASQTNIACNGGATGAASVNIPTGGTAGYSYNWTPGNPTGDGTNSVSGLTAGTWTCTVTDANGCTASRVFTITQPTALSLTAASQTNIACNGDATGTATVSTPTGGTAGYTYNWTPGNPTGDGTTSVSGLTAGTWTCTVTDAYGCTASQIFTITQPTSLVAAAVVNSQESCTGNDGSATASASGGTGPYNYLWSNGAITATVNNLSAGVYNAYITDANNCTSTATVTITQTNTLSGNVTINSNVSCNGGSNGVASANISGGTAPYTYEWSNGGTSASITNLAAGTYGLNSVTDANGCTLANTPMYVTITQPAALTGSITVDAHVSCNGESDGSATAVISGGTLPYSYVWSNGATTSTISGLQAGNYTLYSLTDANGCTLNTVPLLFTITEPTPLVASAVLDNNASCNGGNNGAATASATGGTAPYTYLWSNGANTASISGAPAGTYNAYITDAKGCTSTASITIATDTTPSPIVNAITVNFTGGCDGLGGIYNSTGMINGKYSYLSDSNSSIAISFDGVKWVLHIVGDLMDTGFENTTVPAGLAPPLTGWVATGCGDGTMDIQLAVNVCEGTTIDDVSSITTGTLLQFYTVPAGGSPMMSSDLVTSGDYYVTDTENGCESERTMFSINVNTVPTAPTITASSTTICSGESVTLTSSSPDGNEWSTGETTQSIVVTNADDYWVIVNSNGCSSNASDTVIVTEAAPIDASIYESAPGVYTATESGATYQWYECPNNLLIGETNQDFTPTANGDYKVEIIVGDCIVESVCVTVTSLSVPDYATDSKFYIYPNPSNYLIKIKSKDGGDFQIINTLGSVVKMFKVPSNIETPIVIDGLSDGIYFVKSVHTNYTQKLIIKQ